MFQKPDFGYLNIVEEFLPNYSKISATKRNRLATSGKCMLVIRPIELSELCSTEQ